MAAAAAFDGGEDKVIGEVIAGAPARPKGSRKKTKYADHCLGQSYREALPNSCISSFVSTFRTTARVAPQNSNVFTYVCIYAYPCVRVGLKLYVNI